MPLMTVLLGIALVTLTLALPHTSSPTAWIPFWFGIGFILLGALAFRRSLRKHVMHLAAALGLIGLLGAGFRAVPAAVKLVQGAEVNAAALASTAVMAGLCAVFLGLCVRSFMAARRSVARRGVDEPVQV